MRYFTEIFGIGCVALLAMLVTSLGAFAQTPTTHYVDVDAGVTTGSSCPLATPCALNNIWGTGAGVTLRAGDQISFRVRREGGTVTIEDDIGTTTIANGVLTVGNSITDSVYVSTYIRGRAEPIVEGGTVSFTGKVHFGGAGIAGRLIPRKGTTIRYNDVTVVGNNTTTEVVADPLAQDVTNFFSTDKENGSVSISGSLELTANATFNTLTVESSLTIQGPGDLNEDDDVKDDGENPALVVKQLEVKAGATLTLGTKDNPISTVRVPLTRSMTAPPKGKENELRNDRLIASGTIAGTASIVIGHGGANDPSFEASAPRIAHFFDEYKRYEVDGKSIKESVDYKDCVMIRGGGEIRTAIHAVSAGNVCILLSKVGDVVALGSVLNLNGTTWGDSTVTDIIFRQRVTVDGDVEQWNDARVVFEQGGTVKGSVTLNAGVLPVKDFPVDLYGTANARANFRRIVAFSKSTLTTAGTEDARKKSCDYDSQPLDPAITGTGATDAVKATDVVNKTVEAKNRHGILFPGVQIAGNTTIEEDLVLAFEHAEALATTAGNTDETSKSKCATKVILMEKIVEDPAKDKTASTYTTAVGRDLEIEDDGMVILGGHKLPKLGTVRTNDVYLVHNLNVGRSIYAYDDKPAGATGGDGDGVTITMGAPAVSLIDGMCSGNDVKLGPGNRVTLTNANDHAVVSDNGLTIETLVLHRKLTNEGAGILNTTTVLLQSDGELDSDEDVIVGSELILQGDGLEGELHSSSEITKLTYASSGTDEVPMSAVNTLSIIRGEVEIAEAVTVPTLGLCGGTLVLKDTGDAKKKTLTVTGNLYVKEGVLKKADTKPGDIGTDGGTTATAADGYTLHYTTAKRHEAGLEWSIAPQKVVISNDKAEVVLTGARSVLGAVDIQKGKLHLDGGDLTVGTSDKVPSASRFLAIRDGELDSKGGNVIVHGKVNLSVSNVKEKVASLMTGGGDLRVLGQSNAKGVYTGGTAAVTVGDKSTIDVGMGKFQLGPESTVKVNNLNSDAARGQVTLTADGTVKGEVSVPKGSKRTTITGKIKKLDLVTYDGMANPVDTATDPNWNGGLYFNSTADTLAIDSLSAVNGGVDFDGSNIFINKGLDLSSVQGYLKSDSLAINGDLTLSGTGGIWGEWLDQQNDDGYLTIAGDFTQTETGKADHAGVRLHSKVKKIVMGDMVVSGKARYIAVGAKLVLKGDLDFGRELMDNEKSYLLNANLEFSAADTVQSVTTSAMVDLGNVEINGKGVVVDSSNVTQGAKSILTLRKGAISGDSTWTVKNSGSEDDLRNRNNALETCSTTAPDCAAVIKGGARRAHVSARLSRHVIEGNTEGGKLSGGYLFPVGGSSEGSSYYRPLTVQLEGSDLSEAMSATVSSVTTGEDETPAWPADNIRVAITGGDLLTLDVHADIFWKVELEEALDVNIRVAAGGLTNVFDADGIRIVQWDCDWTNPRLAGNAVTGPADPKSFVTNGYVDGILNLTRNGVDVPECTILGIAANGIENPIHLEEVSGGVARVQFIHNVPMIPAPVDLYLTEDIRLVSGLSFRNATGYAAVGAGTYDEVSIQIQGAPKEQKIELPTLTLQHNTDYVVVAHGTAAKPEFQVLKTRRTSLVENDVDVILVHGSADLDTVSVRVLDPFESNKPTALLANSLAFNNATSYLTLDPGSYNFLVVTKSKEEYAFNMLLNGYENETVVLNLSGLVADKDLTIFGADVRGGILQSVVSTDAEEEVTEIPTEFTLHGNYPNPFNPSTRIQFDLPETAQVTLQVVDMLGRRVMALPAKEFEAGVNRSIELNAVNLASGTYLYRMIATGSESQYVKTGRMTLVK